MLSLNMPRHLSFTILALSIAPIVGCAPASDLSLEDSQSVEDADEDVAEVASALQTHGPTIAMRALANNQFVCADNNGASALISNRPAAGLWETFERVDLGNGNVALRSLSNGKFVAAENGGSSPLIANRTAIGLWETFHWIDLGGGNFALQAAVNGKYVAAENGGSSALIANRTAIGAWETFHQTAVNVTPSSSIGKFFRDPTGPKPVLSYDRGVGTVPVDCGGQQNDGGLCYPYCASGYTGVGPVCWGSCPSDYRDDGATCFRDASIISANTSSCPWYDACGLTFASGCSSCPSGYANDGCTCRRDASLVGKPSYGRGAGVAPTLCPAGKVNEAGLCYTPCSSGYTGVGPTCFIDEIGEAFCDTLYDHQLASAAVNGNVTMSFGIGIGISQGSSVGVETGVVYSQAGEYGCYTSVCTGVVTDVGINAWGAAGLYNSLDTFTGDALTIFQGASIAFAGFQTSQMIDTSTGQLVGTTSQVSLGVGLSPIQLGTQTCTTTVMLR